MSTLARPPDEERRPHVNVVSIRLTKGREVAVVGRLHLNEWTSREGERRSRLQVVADAVQFLKAPRSE